MVIYSSQAEDMENMEERAEAKAVEKEIEHVTAVDILSQYSEEEKAKALRRLDWNLIPLYVTYRIWPFLWMRLTSFDRLGVLYMLSYIDRSNLGNAYTAGMGAAWGITSNQYSWIITAYYLAYIAFQWFILLWKIVSLPVGLLKPTSTHIVELIFLQ